MCRVVPHGRQPPVSSLQADLDDEGATVGVDSRSDPLFYQLEVQSRRTLALTAAALSPLVSLVCARVRVGAQDPPFCTDSVVTPESALRLGRGPWTAVPDTPRSDGTLVCLSSRSRDVE
jgi:hypothetical protein